MPFLQKVKVNNNIPTELIVKRERRQTGLGNDENGIIEHLRLGPEHMAVDKANCLPLRSLCFGLGSIRL